MKKRNRVLEILACTALAAVVFLAYMFTAQDNGVFEIKDIAGDRTHLAEFAFEGIAGDASGQIHYVWQDGELKTEYYPASPEQVDDILYAEKKGHNIFSRYFNRLENHIYSSPDLEAAPGLDASVRTLDSMDDLQEDDRVSLENDLSHRSGYTITGEVADTIDIYAELNDYEARKSTRFFTGVRKTGEEYYFVDVDFADGNGYKMREMVQNQGVSAVELEEAWYVLAHTDETCEGETFLVRIPKSGMISMNERPYFWDDLYSREVFGETEILQTFAVDAGNRVLGMEKAGKDRLLVVCTKEDALMLELYDTEGTLLHRLAAGVPDASIYEINYVDMIQREEQLVLSFELSRKVFPNENEKETYHYEVDGTKYFAVEQDSIRELQAADHLAYLDCQNGMILQLDAQSPEHPAADIWGYMYTGCEMKVTDEKTGKLLYHGEIVTDFAEDYNKLLSALNIGQQAGAIEAKQENKNWEKYHEVSTHDRNFGLILPMEGRRVTSNWAGYSWGEIDGDYYYH